MRNLHDENNISRPTVLTEPTVKILEEVIKDGGNISQACDIAQISRQSFYNFMKDDAEFFYRMSTAREYLKLKALQNVVKAIESGDLKMSVWFLERWSQFDIAFRNKEDSEYTFGVREL